jgi:hypothetical protein
MNLATVNRAGAVITTFAKHTVDDAQGADVTGDGALEDGGS